MDALIQQSEAPGGADHMRTCSASGAGLLRGGLANFAAPAQTMRQLYLKKQGASIASAHPAYVTALSTAFPENQLHPLHFTLSGLCLRNCGHHTLPNAQHNVPEWQCIPPDNSCVKMPSTLGPADPGGHCASAAWVLTEDSSVPLRRPMNCTTAYLPSLYHTVSYFGYTIHTRVNRNWVNRGPHLGEGVAGLREAGPGVAGGSCRWGTAP